LDGSALGRPTVHGSILDGAATHGPALSSAALGRPALDGSILDGAALDGSVLAAAGRGDAVLGVAVGDGLLRGILGALGRDSRLAGARLRHADDLAVGQPDVRRRVRLDQAEPARRRV
jgi:hypothetical protein